MGNYHIFAIQRFGPSGRRRSEGFRFRLHNEALSVSKNTESGHLEKVWALGAKGRV